MTKELMIPNDLTPEVFNNVEPLLKDIQAKVANFNGDVSTDIGRKKIASFAFKISRSKTAVDNMGKEHVAKLKQLPKLVDEQRKIFRDGMDEMRDAVRKPLTDWEDADKERIAVHEGNIAEIVNAGLVSWQVMCIDALKDRLAELQREKATDWQEFAERASKVIAEAIEKTEVAIANRETHDKEQAELEQLRKEKAEREQNERDERIRKEAEEKAKQEAEIEAKREAKKVEAEKLRVIQEKEESERKTKEAEQRAKEAEARAKREAKEAVTRERERVEAAKEKERQEVAKREANKAHKEKILQACIQDLINAGMDSEQATIAIKAISDGLVQNISIRF
ncbi:MAG: hypothetical protein V3V81_07620 [Candidatus Bathyarchaeia archaeon]